MAQASAKKTIRQLRQDQGWTQLQLAWRLGGTAGLRGAVGEWPSGTTAGDPAAPSRLHAR